MTSHAKAVDHERIWLQNAEDGAASGEGRMWCEDKAWPVDENDGEPTEYVRADIHQAALALIAQQADEIERLKNALRAADVTLTSDDAFDLDPILGSHNPHEHAAGLVRAALSPVEKEKG